MSARSRWFRLFGGLSIAVGAALFMDRLRCFIGGVHDPRRHPRLLGFICRRCGHPGSTLSDMGFSALDDYVSPIRRGVGKTAGREFTELEER